MCLRIPHLAEILVNGQVDPPSLSECGDGLEAKITRQEIACRTNKGRNPVSPVSCKEVENCEMH